MPAVRRLLAQRRLAMLLCVATLLLKLLVPAGYMIGGEPGRLTFQPCSGLIAGPMTTMAMPDGHAHGQPHDHDKAEKPCAFAGLSAAALGAVDPIQLASLLAFVRAAGFMADLPSPFCRSGPLRPPARAPPALPLIP